MYLCSFCLQTPYATTTDDNAFAMMFVCLLLSRSACFVLIDADVRNDEDGWLDVVCHWASIGV